VTRPTHDRTFECLGAARRAQLVLQEEAEHADSKRSVYLHQRDRRLRLRRVANVSLARVAELKRALLA